MCSHHAFFKQLSMAFYDKYTDLQTFELFMLAWAIIPYGANLSEASAMLQYTDCSILVATE